MNNIIKNKLDNNELLTNDEIAEVLNFIKNIVKEKITSKDNKTCFESNMAISFLCDDIGIAFYPLQTKELDMAELLHYSGFIGFNTENGPLWVLMDLTYDQFLDNDYPIYIDNKECNILPPGNFLSEENINELNSKGYITLTRDNYISYINSFIESYSTVKKVNKREILNKAFNLLNRNNIKFVSEEVSKSQKKF